MDVPILPFRAGLPHYEAEQPVSVVLICHNKAPCLPALIGSLHKNTRRPDWVILCDDASTDASREVFCQYCSDYGLSHKVLAHEAAEKPFRLNTLRNEGIAACPDGLVLILDADHVPARTHVEAHVNLHLARAEGVLSTGPRLEFANEDGSGPINFMWGHEAISMLPPDAERPLSSWTGVLASNLGLVRQAFLSLGGFDPQYDGNYGYDDVDFTYRAWQAGYFFAASFEAYVIHIPHPAFQNRSGEVNTRRFISKFGFPLQYPPSYIALSRGTTWSHYYAMLVKQAAAQPAGPMQEKVPIVPMLDLDVVGGRALLSALWRRIVRLLRHRLGP